MSKIIVIDDYFRMDLNRYSAEASDLGWQAGHWPSELTVLDGTTTMTFSRHSRVLDASGEDLQAVIYKWGSKLFTIYND